MAVVAYRSEREFQDELPLEDVPAGSGDQQARLAFLIGQRLAVPANDAEPDEALKEAIQLSRDNAKFQDRRRKFYEWQHERIRDIADEGMLPANAVKEMERLVGDYNSCVEKATKERRYKFAFTVVAVAVTLAGAPVTPLVGAGAFLALTKFARYDSRLDVRADEAEPAAMFHDIHKLKSWR